MHIVVGAIFLVLGISSVLYIRSGAAIFQREPPLIAFGVLGIAVGAGFWARSRAAGLVARVGLAAAFVAIVWSAVMSYRSSGTERLTDDPLLHFRVLGLAVVAAALVFFFMLARRAPRAPAFGAVDLVPLAGLIAASILVVIWVRAEDVTLRPCRLGNEAACETIAGELIETAERSPIAAPIPWEDRAAGVLDQRACPGSEPAPCAVQLYAVGSVAVRAGRADAAKDAFMRACETDRGWCARAAQEKLVHWTDEERERLGRRAGG